MRLPAFIPATGRVAALRFGKPRDGLGPCGARCCFEPSIECCSAQAKQAGSSLHRLRLIRGSSQRLANESLLPLVDAKRWNVLRYRYGITHVGDCSQVDRNCNALPPHLPAKSETISRDRLLRLAARLLYVFNTSLQRETISISLRRMVLTSQS
jgi:hypothetical protein